MSTGAWVPANEDELKKQWESVDEGKSNVPTDTGVWNGLKRAAGNLISLPGQVYHAVADEPRNQDEALTSEAGIPAPFMTLKGRPALAAKRLLADPMIQQEERAKEYYSKANNDPDSDAAHMGNMHTIASKVPIVGPVAGELTDRYLNGDKSGALAEGATYVAAPKVVGKVAGSVVDSVKGGGIMRGVDNIALGKEPPAKILTRAMKPPVTYPEFESVVDSRLPEIAKGSKAPITNVKDFTKTVDDLAKQKDAEYQQLINPFRRPDGGIGPYRPLHIDANPVADAQMESIPALDRFEKPNTLKETVIQRGNRHIVESEGNEGIAAKTAEKAAPFRRDVPIGDLDDIRVDSNAKLKSFYDKAGGDRFAALSNPETARIKAINDTTRDLVYGRLKDETGVDAHPIQNAYGDFRDLGDVSGKRATVYGRQQPFPLQEQLTAADALAQGNPVKFGLARLFKRYGDSDKLTKIALDRFSRQTPSPRVVGKVKRGPAVVGSMAGGTRKDDEQ